MNQAHYEILKVLYDNNKVSAVSGMKMSDILEHGKISGTLFLSPNTVYKQLLTLKKDGLIEIGLRIGKENSYYITQLGILRKAQLEGGN